MKQKLPCAPCKPHYLFQSPQISSGFAYKCLFPFSLLELALKHSAVILTPDYRLRPEHDFPDSFDDIKSFWQWIEDGSAQRLLSTSLPGIIVDADSLMVAGESTGGCLAVQTALLSLTKLPIKVLFLQYPTLDIGEHIRIENPSELMLKCAVWADRTPYSEVEAVLNRLKKGKICTRAPFGTRMHLLQALVQAGKFCDFSGDRELLDPIRALEHAGPLPPILLYHSKEDEALPWQHTDAWASRLKTLQPDVPLYLTYQTGSHVFDVNDTMATPWLKEPLEFVQRYWPA